jgi:hypothetical protein
MNNQQVVVPPSLSVVHLPLLVDRLAEERGIRSLAHDALAVATRIPTGTYNEAASSGNHSRSDSGPFSLWDMDIRGSTVEGM